MYILFHFKFVVSIMHLERASEGQGRAMGRASGSVCCLEQVLNLERYVEREYFGSILAESWWLRSEEHPQIFCYLRTSLVLGYNLYAFQHSQFPESVLGYCNGSGMRNYQEEVHTKWPLKLTKISHIYLFIITSCILLRSCTSICHYLESSLVMSWWILYALFFYLILI